MGECVVLQDQCLLPGDATLLQIFAIVLSENTGDLVDNVSIIQI